VLEILFRPKFLVALLAAISSYALMSFVMTATPIAMIDHHHHHSDAQLGIQWHVIAMFGPSFFSGGLVGRFGKTRMASAGLLLIALSAVIALAGTTLAHFWIALILLGIGWNFGFVAATAMVAELYRPEEAFRVQAMNEFILFGFVALASFSAGKVLAGAGWDAVNWGVFPVVAVTLLALAAQSIADRREGPAPTTR
jgi:MFS family permease